MKKSIILLGIVALILQISLSTAFWFPLSFFNLGISGRVTQNIQNDSIIQNFNITLTYQGYENYIDYDWVLVKSDKAKGLSDFYWRTNDFAEAVKIKSTIPVLISNSYAILTLKQFPIGSCIKCRELILKMDKKEFVSSVSAVIKGRADIDVYFGKKKLNKWRFVKNSVSLPGKITDKEENMGKISSFIKKEEIISLNNVTYTVSVNESNLYAYFNNTGNGVSRDVNSDIIVKNLKK
jgi:hypothetical protein